MSKFHTLTIDFETFYDSKDKYSLRNMPAILYIRDPRFKVHGCAVKIDDRPTRWLNAANTRKFFDTVPWDRIILQGWNLTGFDAVILSEIYGKRPKLYIDGLGLSRAINGSQVKRHGLTYVAEHMGLGSKLDGGAALQAVNGVRKLTAEQFKELGKYAVVDNELCYQIIEQLRRQFPKNEIRILDWTVRMACDPKLQLDGDLLERAYKEEVKRKDKLLSELGLDAKSIRSNKLFADLLTRAGITPPTKISKTTGKSTFAFSKTDKEFIDLGNNEATPQLARDLIGCRLGTKSSIVETRLRQFADIAATGPMPVFLNYSGAHTNRLSGGGGLNQQNLPKKGALRNSIHVDDDETMIVADSSQIEARVLAHIAGQTDLVDAFRQGRDVYSEFAAKVFGVDAEKIRAGAKSGDATFTRMRHLGKVAVLSCGYGASWKAYQKMLWVQSGGSLTLDDRTAKQVVQTYRTANAEIVKFWQLCDSILAGMSGDEREQNIMPDRVPIIVMYSEQRIIMPSSLTLQYPDLRRVQGKRGYEYIYRAGPADVKTYGASIAENITQSLARDVLTYQVGLCLDKGLPPVMQVHDELGFVVPKAKGAAATRTVRTIMSTTPPWLAGCPITCEANMGSIYGAIK